MGAGLGMFAGLLTVACFKAAGTSYDEIISTEYQRWALEIEKTVQAMHEAREEVDRAHSLSEFQDSLLNETSGTTTSSPSPSPAIQNSPSESGTSDQSQKNANVGNLRLDKTESKS